MVQEVKKGQRHGDFECKMCNKFFKYVKPYKNHMKMHNVRSPAMPKVKEKLSYYKRKKLQDALQNAIPKKKALVPTPKRSSSSLQYADSSPEPQPEYDSLSPYQNSPAYEDDSIIPQDNQDDMDFGALMLSTSQMIGEEVEKDNPEPRKSRTGRILKRSIIEDDDEIVKPNGQKRSKPSSAPSKALPTRKPGPLSSKIRSKPAKQNDSEEVTIEGFSEVDISKMLKKSSDSMTRLSMSNFKA
jgi:hypothetical protein